jgi:hypothetical protein
MADTLKCSEDMRQVIIDMENISGNGDMAQLSCNTGDTGRARLRIRLRLLLKNYRAVLRGT